MSKQREIYYTWCKECEHLYHCFGRDIGEKIESNEEVDMYLQSGSCRNYYPLVTG